MFRHAIKISFVLGCLCIAVQAHQALDDEGETDFDQLIIPDELNSEEVEVVAQTDKKAVDPKDFAKLDDFV